MRSAGESDGQHLLKHPIHPPSQVHGRGPGGLEAIACLADERRIIGSLFPVLGGKHHPVGTGNADEWCAPDEHLLNGMDHLIHGGQIGNRELVRQLTLVDHLHGDPVFVQPDRPNLFSINNHRAILWKIN